MADRYDASIDAFWDSRNGQAGATPVLDAELAATIQQLHSLYASSPPNSTRERVRQRVLLDPSAFATENAHDMDALALPHPRPAQPSLRAPRETAPHRPSLWLALAAAAVILFASLGGWFAYERLGGNDAHPAVIPAAQDATPTVESGWPQFRGGPARTGYTSDPGPGANLDLRWSFAADDMLGNLVTDAGSVYVYGRQGNLFVLDAVTGAQRWALDLSTGEYSDENRWPTPAVADGVIYVGTFDGNVLSIDASDGSVIWQRAPSIHPIVSTPLYLDGQLYQVTPEGTIVRLDAATGETVWTWSGDTELSNWSSAAGDGLLFMADVGGDLVAIETATGTTKWITDLNDARRNPAYANGVVYTGSDSKRHYALDATDGSVIWQTEPAEGEQALNPVVTPDALIMSYMNGPMEALDRATGAVLWSVDGPGSSLSPHASALAVYCVSADLTSLVAYDLKTGAELGRIKAGGLGSIAAISGDTIIFGTFDAGGAVRAIGPSDGEPISVSAGPATVVPAVTEIAQGQPTIATPSTSFDGSQVELVWQSTGDASVPLQFPAGLSIGPDGMLYVADQGLGPIQSFTPDGAFQESWGEQGSGPGQFQAPTSIVFDNDGNRYVADLGNSRIQKFAPDGTFLLEWGSQGDANGQFSEPNIVAIDPAAGRLYVTEFLNNRVQVFDLDGNFIEKWGSRGSRNGQFVNPAGVAVNVDGLVFVGDTNNGSGGRVQIFDAYGTWQGSLPETFTEVWAMAFDAAGNLYVADYWKNRIQVYDPNLVLIGTIEDVDGAGPFSHPTGLFFDADSLLYVSDGDNHRILKLQLPPLDA